MKIIEVAKAEPTGGTEVPSVIIKISGVLLSPGTVKRGRQNQFTRDAKLLSDALKKSLPNGTLDALLVELMQNRACLFRVPLFEKQA
jgi:hypothetical protein